MLTPPGQSALILSLKGQFLPVGFFAAVSEGAW